MRAIRFLAGAFLAVASMGACAAPCPADDFETRVTGVSQCLLMRRYGPAEPAAMVVDWVARVPDSARGIDAIFQPVPDATHNSASRSPAVTQAIDALLRRAGR